MINLTPTAEQQNAIDLVGRESRLKIQAYAGAAKSTTLAMIAHKYNVPSLYLTFNKVMADEAKKMFPDWVDCRTTHSLAYAAIGRSIAHKLTRPQGAYVNVCGTAREIARYYKINAIALNKEDRIPAIAIGLSVKETVEAFERSDDTELKPEHVSLLMRNKQRGNDVVSLLKGDNDAVQIYREWYLIMHVSCGNYAVIQKVMCWHHMIPI